MKVLVLGMGSNVSQGIVKALRMIDSIPIEVIGACISRTSVGLYLCDEAIIMPKAIDDCFVPWYIKTCIDKKIDITFSGVEENIESLVRNKEMIEKSCDTCFVYPDLDSWEIGRDKYETCKWLKNRNIPYPLFSLATDDIGISELVRIVGFPLVAKPRIGKSSMGVIVANSLKDLAGVIGRSDYIIQEYIGSLDDEYTVGCYFSKDEKLVSSIILHRYLRNGGTVMAETVHNDVIGAMVKQIANNLHFSGPLNIQLRLRPDGVPVCFELNVRYSGTTAIRNHFGFRDIEAAIREYVLGKSVDKCFTPVASGVSIRYENEVYFENKSFKDLYSDMKLT